MCRLLCRCCRRRRQPLHRPPRFYVHQWKRYYITLVIRRIWGKFGANWQDRPRLGDDTGPRRAWPRWRRW